MFVLSHKQTAKYFLNNQLLYKNHELKYKGGGGLWDLVLPDFSRVSQVQNLLLYNY